MADFQELLLQVSERGHKNTHIQMQAEHTRALASAVYGQISSVLHAQQKRPQMFSES